jgi:Domain of unknown function (DUF4203)
MLPAAYQVPAAVLLLAGGVLACFLGHRLFRIVLGLYGFIMGALLATAITGPTHTQSALFAMLIGGAAGALLLVVAYFVGVALVGAALGAIIIHAIWSQLGSEPHPLIVIAGTIAGSLCAMALQRYVIILGTAFGGAWTTLAGAIALASHRAAQTADAWVLYPLRPPAGHDWVWFGWLTLGAAGAVVQLASRPRSAKR